MARRPAARARSRQNKVNDSLIANPMPWPHGARCAVAITFDIDTDSFLHLEHRDKAPDMQKTGKVWFATMEEIAAHTKACIAAGSWTPRIQQMPFYDAPIPELRQAAE